MTTNSGWQTLYEQLLCVLSRHGVNDPFGDGDFFLVDDDYGCSQQKVECMKAEAVTPALISDVQKLLSGFPTEWEVIFAVPVSEENQGAFVVKVGSCVERAA